MLIYVTRHGQPDLEKVSWKANPDIPLCDPVLTDKGRIQAKYLGQFLKQKKFNGLIISSPYRRTLETAQIVAEQTNSTIKVEPMIQEYVTKEGFPDFNGLNIKQIQRCYKNVSRDCEMDYPWFSQGPETLEKVKKRVAPIITRLLKSDTEVLLVGHGASVHACKEVILKNAFNKNIPEKHNWNCSLSTYIFDNTRKLKKYKLFDTKHMPEDIITSNMRLYCRELEYAI
ncbi:MAG: histidine phosphatase family protein [Victivallaceae bacterium]|nr:histidine phosphatase family protein [Victivallaceae bacterium]